MFHLDFVIIPSFNYHSVKKPLISWLVLYIIVYRAFLFLSKKLQLSPLERSLYSNLLSEFSGFAKAQEVRFFIAYGALLGIVRHGDVLPWDDDIDLVFDGAKQHELIQHFNGRVSKICFESPIESKIQLGR